eukprot:TRINITY_DN9517_c0_g1_i1.p3 TRINITY_DN9517_c0_g1~~TRINITY_DN9517_c0_g1_i1.p3  ORF type:complete len:300 (+),score=24.66 TRINITY_DN9517_c0_g1_i1:134-901(+)
MEEQTPNNCEICQQKTWKYKCPRCSLKTCSLDCVNKHKTETQCSGKRKRTEFVPMDKFDDNLLIKDYKLLQEIIETKERAQKRQKGNKFQRSTKRLKSLAHKKGIDLRFMPSESTKRIQNTTRWKGDIIMWKVCWKFEKINQELMSRNVDENSALKEELEKSLENVDAETKFKLREYVNAGIHKLKLALIYYKSDEEGVKIGDGNQQQYTEIGMDQTLKQALAGNVIVEHPEILVLFQEDVTDKCFVKQSVKSSV